MKKQNMQGLFITIEGPNGVGKSTFIKKLQSKLMTEYNVFITKEPTDTSFGIFVKNNEGHLHGLSYAYLICSDRCNHNENEIIPHLKKNEIVLCDRYIESSLVYQKFDGVKQDTIWALNKDFLMPDISVLLLADIDTIEKRLAERSELSDFEIRMSRANEIEAYKSAHAFLNTKGFNCIQYINNNSSDIEINIRDVYNKIKNLLR